MPEEETDLQISNLKPAFARHKLGYAVEYLWDERRIAIHWESIPSADSGKYKDGRGTTEIGILGGIATNGAIVGASYRSLYKNKMLVGLVEPESPIDLLFINSDTGSVEHIESVDSGDSIEYPAKAPSDAVIYKSIKLSQVEVITRQEQPILFDDGVRPPFWSVCEWEGAEDQLRAISEGETVPYEVGSLTTQQLEIVCEEYLRMVDEEYYRTSEIGGVMSDVDIMGASGDELVWAQVTQGGSDKVKKKIGKLGDYAEKDARVIIFAPEDSRPSELDSGITFISVEAVFETVNLNAKGSLLLSRLLGLIG